MLVGFPGGKHLGDNSFQHLHHLSPTAPPPQKSLLEKTVPTNQAKMSSSPLLSGWYFQSFFVHIVIPENSITTMMTHHSGSPLLLIVDRRLVAQPGFLAQFKTIH